MDWRGLLVYCIDLIRKPAITIARSLSNTFAGIRPADVPAFIVAQLAGALLGLWVARGLFRTSPATATERSIASARGSARTGLDEILEQFDCRSHANPIGSLIMLATRGRDLPSLD
jgi:glycerol uptake facilitator-like aquaporin